MRACHLHVLHAAAGWAESRVHRGGGLEVWKDEDPYFIRLANDIRDALVDAELDVMAPGIRDLLDMAEEGEAMFVSRLNGVVRELQEVVPDGVAEELENRLALAYARGAIDVSQTSPDWAFNRTDEEALAWLKKDCLYWVGNRYGPEVSATIRDAVGPAFTQGLGRDAVGRLLRQAFNQLRQRNESYWTGLANHVVTRSRAFGFTEGMDRAGFTEAEISAVLDDTTTEICREMDGRTVLVRDMLDLRSGLMGAQSPEAVKDLAPWQTTTAQVESTVATCDLLGHVPPSMALPPYHFHCRTALVVRRG